MHGECSKLCWEKAFKRPQKEVGVPVILGMGDSSSQEWGGSYPRSGGSLIPGMEVFHPRNEGFHPRNGGFLIPGIGGFLTPLLGGLSPRIQPLTPGMGAPWSLFGVQWGYPNPAVPLAVAALGSSHLGAGFSFPGFFSSHFFFYTLFYDKLYFTSDI